MKFAPDCLAADDIVAALRPGEVVLLENTRFYKAEDGKVKKDDEKKGIHLTDEEYAEMKKHTIYGGKMLDNVEGDIMSMAKTVALEHHERVDGKGYPTGMKGDEISMEGRIVAVADVYDALTSKRSYKDAWDAKDAYDEIVRCSGTQFDETVVEAFKRAYDQIEETRRHYAGATA